MTARARNQPAHTTRGTNESRFALAPRFIRNVPPDQTLKSHFNEKGKSRITALPLLDDEDDDDDGAAPAPAPARRGTVDR